MNISCNIIRDLLPLYAEDLASADSQQLVDEHLCGCDACAAEYARLKKATPIPLEVDTASLNKIKKTIAVRRFFSAMAAVLAILTMGSLILSWLTAGILLPADKAIDNVYVQEDGALVIDYAAGIMGHGNVALDDRSDALLCYTTRYDYFRGQHRGTVEEVFGGDGIVTEEEQQRYDNLHICYGIWESPEGFRWIHPPKSMLEEAGEEYTLVQAATDLSYWYPDPWTGNTDSLIFDGGNPVPEGGIPWNPEYAIFFGLFLVLAITFWLISQKNRNFGRKEFFLSLGIACACAAFSILFVSGGKLYAVWCGFNDVHWLSYIFMNSLLLTATSLTFRRLHLLRKMDKAA